MKHNNIRIIGRLEGEEEEQGIENLYEKVMTKTSQTWWEKKSHKSKKHRESQSIEPKETHPKTYHN